jgi:ABC-2 type transport system permease protein
MIWTIAYRELRNLFLSPLAWTILAITQVIFGLVFSAQISSYDGGKGTEGVTAAVALPLFGWSSVLLLFVIPLLTMRSIAEERRNNTLTLLFSAPVSMAEIVLGKYFGVILYLLILSALILVMPFSLLIGASLDFGLLASAVFGLILLLSSFTAIGVFMSTLTKSPTLAAMGSFGALFLLWMFALSADMFGDNVLSYLSIINHFVPFLEGIFNTRDVIYYLTVATVFLTFSIRRLNMDRLGA